MVFVNAVLANYQILKARERNSLGEKQLTQVKAT